MTKIQIINKIESKNDENKIKAGDYYRNLIWGDIFIVANIDMPFLSGIKRYYVLVRVDGGGYFSYPREQIENIFCGQADDFELIDNVSITIS